MVSTTAKAKRKKSADQSKGASLSDFARLAGGKGEAQRAQADIWEGWSRHLSERNSPVEPHRWNIKLHGHPLLWFLPATVRGDADLSTRILDWLMAPASSGNKRNTASELSAAAQAWLAHTAGQDRNVVYAVECLAWAYALPRLASILDAHVWWEIFDHLTSVASEASLVFGKVTTDAAQSAWTGQLLAAELPLVLGYLLPELSGAKQLVERGRKFATESVEEMLDGQGLLQAEYLRVLSPLAACWSRCLMLADHANKRFPRKIRNQYDCLIEHVLRLIRNDGSTVFAPKVPKSARKENYKLFEDFLACANLMAEDNDAKSLIEMANGGSRLARAKSAATKRERRQQTRLEENVTGWPSYDSEWSEVAVLQPEWCWDATRLVVDFSDRRVHGELSVRGTTFFSGEWPLAVRVNGDEVPLSSDWSISCWHSDEDVDFLEIQADLANGGEIQRQFVFAREDQFLYLADVVVNREGQGVELEGHYALAPSISFSSGSETTEGTLAKRKKCQVLVLPVALPEWRTGNTLGELDEQEDGLRYLVRSQGPNLHAAHFLDFHPQRSRKTPTWRQLTVVDELRLVDDNEAVSYRIQVGPEQWVIYRSLRKTISRTFLGQHSAAEFVCARFLSNGDVEELVEVELE
ncbi:MAG: hypothetical protein KDA60_15175 [Planctomycetales bacterium]|nr:hypothetical protein [Planctomycetales bacterium]